MRLASFILLAAVLLNGAAASAQQSQLSALGQFQHLEDDWSVALVNRDQFALDNLLAPGCIDISAGAQVRTRNQFIADSLAGLPEPLLSIEQKVVTVRTIGDVAIVQGTYSLRWREPASRAHDERGIFTHVYQRVHDRWAVVNAQRTAVVNTVERDKQKQSVNNSGKKKSDLPFHIPLLSRDSKSNDSDSASPGAPQ